MCRSPAYTFVEILAFSWLVIVVLSLPVAADDYSVEVIDEPAEDVSEQVAELLSPQGVHIEGPRRGLCDIWLAKALATVADFEPDLTVKYPLTPGQFIGVMVVPRRSRLSDFKGQEIDRGVYTLRYGQQPMDGNHIGTSDTSDFLLAVPADDDEDPAAIEDIDDLFGRSADAAGTTHPAIFSLLPAAEGEATDGESPELIHDEDHDFWILQLPAATEGDTKLSLRLIVVGESEG